jgi:superfamily II RNA helicase
MPKNMLKSYGRFELLELIYAMRKENLELKERCETAEKQVVEIKMQTEKQLDNARRDYENRIEELRMQGAAKDLQIRMKKIEEQLRLMQRLTSIDVDPEEVNRLAQDIEEHSEQEQAEQENGQEEKR